MALPEINMSERKRHHLPIIPLSRYPLTTIHEGLLYEVHKVTRENRGRLRLRALPFEEQFDYGDPFFTRDKITHYIKEGGEVVFTTTMGRNTRDVAVVTQEMRRVIVGGQETNMLSIGIRAVKEEYQRQGIGRHQVRDTMMRLQPDAITGQFRTYRIPRMYQEIDFIRSLTPIDADAPITDEMRELVEAVVDKSTFKATNSGTFVAMGIFPPGESKRFAPPPTNEKAVAVDRRIRALGAIPERGDAIRYFATVDLAAVHAAIDAGYFPAESLEHGRLGATARSIKRFLGGFLNRRHPR